MGNNSDNPLVKVEGRMIPENSIVNSDDLLLVTGSNGFIGSRVVRTLLDYGFLNLRCLVRSPGNQDRLREAHTVCKDCRVEIMLGNLLSPEDCMQAVQNVKVIFHLAAGIDKSYAGAFMNTVVATHNLLEASREVSILTRFVNVSSFAVYSTQNLRSGQLIDETCKVESRPELRAEAYCYSKVKQDELVMAYGRQYDLPYVIIRPGAVFGPGKDAITGRVGITSFGPFIHLGAANEIPFTYIDNCAEAIVLAGIKPGVESEVFNVVDDNRPSSREFLRLYKENVGDFRSIDVPRKVSYLLCFFWEKYSQWSRGQLPPVYNRNRWAAEWKGQRYSNRKLKTLLGWKPQIPIDEALTLYFGYIKQNRGAR